jgi:hypothetical protein
VVIFAGWFGVRDQQSVVEQIPYVVSGGIGGIALIGVGAAILHLTRQARLEQKMDDLAARQEALEESVHAFIMALSKQMDLTVPLTNLGRGSSGNGQDLSLLHDPDEVTS